MDRKNHWAWLVLCLLAGMLSACQDHPAAQEASHAAVPSAVVATATAAPAAPAFVVGTLEENDGDADLQGCTTSLTQVAGASSPGDTFRESSTDNEGVGFIRIDGKLMRVTLEHADNKAHDATLVFEDAAHTLKVVEAVQSGETNENTDSTALSGTLTITYRGTTQTLHVEGGVAC